MRINYTCECCGEDIDVLEVEQVDEIRLGFDHLTAEERQDMVKVDYLTDTMYVQSLCDNCIEILGLADEELMPRANLLH